MTSNASFRYTLQALVTHVQLMHTKCFSSWDDWCNHGEALEKQMKDMKSRHDHCTLTFDEISWRRALHGIMNVYASGFAHLNVNRDRPTVGLQRQTSFA